MSLFLTIAFGVASSIVIILLTDAATVITFPVFWFRDEFSIVLSVGDFWRAEQAEAGVDVSVAAVPDSL